MLKHKTVNHSKFDVYFFFLVIVTLFLKTGNIHQLLNTVRRLRKVSLLCSPSGRLSFSLFERVVIKHVAASDIYKILLKMNSETVSEKHIIFTWFMRERSESVGFFLFLAETWGMIWQEEDEIYRRACWDPAANGGWLHNDLHHRQTVRYSTVRAFFWLQKRCAGL